MSAVILIKRKVPRGKESELVPLLIQLRALAVSQPGYISGQTLRRVDISGEYLVLSTWQSVESWETWLRSKQRNEIQERIDTILGEKTEYEVYHHG